MSQDTTLTQKVTQISRNKKFLLSLLKENANMFLNESSVVLLTEPLSSSTCTWYTGKAILIPKIPGSHMAKSSISKKFRTQHSNSPAMFPSSRTYRKEFTNSRRLDPKPEGAVANSTTPYHLFLSMT